MALSKLDLDMNYYWVSTWEYDDATNGWGPSGKVAEDSQGSTYVTGWNSIRKSDSSGNSQWVLSYVATDDIAVSQGNDLYLTGWFVGQTDLDPGSGQFLIQLTNDWYNKGAGFLVKLTQSGDLQWAIPFASI